MVRKPLHLGIDASNIRTGGGLTHLAQVLACLNPFDAGIDQVTVWSGRHTLERLADRPWLVKMHSPVLERPVAVRALWQKFALPRLLRKAGCDRVFIPGGLAPGDCGMPLYTMAQNLLPFQLLELRRAPAFTSLRWKLELLRIGQRATLERADGVIFPSEFAGREVLRGLRKPPASSTVIPHGIEERFFGLPKPARRIEMCDDARPFRLLYVSTVFPYKHPWHVASAVKTLRDEGCPVAIDFVGGGDPGSVARLTRTLNELDPAGSFLMYHGEVPFDRVHQAYREADLFVFASSCETYGCVLLEAMAAPLPVASSNRGPMPEILGDAAIYFDPESPSSIAKALRALIADPVQRDRQMTLALERARSHSWDRCARETFRFVAGYPPQTTRLSVGN